MEVLLNLCIKRNKKRIIIYNRYVTKQDIKLSNTKEFENFKREDI